MSEYLKLLIPVLTFFMGAVLTLLVERNKRRNVSVALYARELSDCASDWHKQLCEIEDVALQGKDEEAFLEKSKFYIKNRFLLPKFLRAKTALLLHKDAKEIIAEADAILQLLTKPCSLNDGSTFVGMFPDQNSVVDVAFPVEMPRIFRKSEIQFSSDITLSGAIHRLDGHVQKINILAGKLL
jgi:hypothetical protein